MNEASRYLPEEVIQKRSAKKRRTNIRVGSALAAVALGGALVSGCSDEAKISSGTVYSKEHQDSYVTIMPIGKVMMPIFHPERYEISFKQCKEPEKQNCRTNEEDVDKAKYDSIKIGQYVDFTPKKSN